MTRNEYRQLVRNTFTGKGWEYYWQHWNFSDLVNSVALELFYQKDLTSPLAIETHHRFKQLKETGETGP